MSYTKKLTLGAAAALACLSILGFAPSATADEQTVGASGIIAPDVGVANYGDVRLRETDVRIVRNAPVEEPSDPGYARNGGVVIEDPDTGYARNGGVVVEAPDLGYARNGAVDPWLPDTGTTPVSVDNAGTDTTRILIGSLAGLGAAAAAGVAFVMMRRQRHLAHPA